MEATPDVYRADIAHTQHHIALIDAGDLRGDTHEQAQERRARLVRQIANLERGLARAERLWAQAQAQEGSVAGPRCPDCHDPMRQTHTGGGTRRQDAWICRRAEAEVSTDERGHQHRAPGAAHAYTRVWTASELAQ